jgi:hypothetical protein
MHLCCNCWRPADFKLIRRTFRGEILQSTAKDYYCAACQPELVETEHFDSTYGYRSNLQYALWPLDDAEIYAVRRISCVVCRTQTEYTVCPDCLRSQAQGKLIAKKLKKLRKEETHMDKKLAPNISAEVQDGLWRAGAEALVETARDTLVVLLTEDIQDSTERDTARSVLTRALSGKLGKAIVAATAGSALYAAQSYDIKTPFVEPDVAERMGREFRVLAVASASLTAFNHFVGPLRDLAVDKLGGLVSGLGEAQRLVHKAKQT